MFSVRYSNIKVERYIGCCRCTIIANLRRYMYSYFTVCLNFISYYRKLFHVCVYMYHMNSKCSYHGVNAAPIWEAEV